MSDTLKMESSPKVLIRQKRTGIVSTSQLQDDSASSSASSKTDDELSSSNMEDSQMEARVLRKMDLYIIPLMMLLYFLSNLDKSNIGNAEVSGLSTDLHLKGAQFNICVSAFFGPYIVSELFGTHLVKVLGPNVVMSICILGFGLISLLTAWCTSYGALLACRVSLGLFEGMVFPTINMYLSICYRREQYARRFAYVFFSAGLSSSFGGLIAYCCSKIHGTLASWQYIFIIEGAISLGVVPLFIFGLARDLENSWFFSTDERQYIIRRYQTMSTVNPDERFDWHQFKLGVIDIKTWISSIALFGIDMTTFGLTTFLPSIISAMGYGSIKAQLLTIPVFALTALTFLLCALWSDHLELRSPFIIAACLTTSIGIVIVLVAKAQGVRYFGVYILCMGIYVNAACNCLWLSGNNGCYFKRATAVGINLFFGSSSGLVSGQIFPASDKPRFTKGLSICLAFQSLSIIMTCIQFLLYRRENHKKTDEINIYLLLGHDIPFEEKLGDMNLEFRYMY